MPTSPFDLDEVTTGTFESGTTEYYGVLYNDLDLENGAARNGFVLYTDPVADADFLYQPSSGMFMSLDTPHRSSQRIAQRHLLSAVSRRPPRYGPRRRMKASSTRVEISARTTQLFAARVAIRYKT